MFAFRSFEGRRSALMRHSRAFSALATAAVLAAGAARADEIQNKSSVFAGLDKITGRIVKFQAQIGETVQFGTLQITPRACYTKPQTETPQTVGFVQVDEVAAEAKAKVKRLFSGWMFAASPGLNGVEHPVYDVWLLDCRGGFHTLPETAEAEAPAFAPAPPAAAAAATPQSHASLPADAMAPSPARPAAAAQPGPSAPLAVPSKPVRSGAAAPALAPPIEVGEAPVDKPLVDAPPRLPSELNGRRRSQRDASTPAPRDDAIPQGADPSGFDGQSPDAFDSPNADPNADPNAYAPEAPNPFARGARTPGFDSPPRANAQNRNGGQDPFGRAAPDDGGLRPPALIPN
jgi:hypothetical protein